MNINEKRVCELDAHLTITRLTEDAYMLVDDRNATGYVIVGSEKALVIDTLLGHQNLKEVVSSITDLPVIVVNTHAHFDHCGGNGYFDSALIGEAEIPEYQTLYQRNDIPTPCPVEVLREGDTIDLGDRTIEVFAFIGHTPGALVLLDRKDRILYTGDSILGKTVWLFMENSAPVSVMKESLLHINAYREAFDSLATGHGHALNPTYLIDSLLEACDVVLKGEPKERFGTAVALGREVPCCYYRGEDEVQATLLVAPRLRY